MRTDATKPLRCFFSVRKLLLRLTCSSAQASVLTALAGFARSDGTSIFQSYDSLASVTKLSRRCVVDAVSAWINTGLLVLVQKGVGRNLSNEYRIKLPEIIDLDSEVARINSILNGAPPAPFSGLNSAPDSKKTSEIVHRVHPIVRSLSGAAAGAVGSGVDVGETGRVEALSAPIVSRRLLCTGRSDDTSLRPSQSSTPKIEQQKATAKTVLLREGYSEPLLDLAFVRSLDINEATRKTAPRTAAWFVAAGRNTLTDPDERAHVEALLVERTAKGIKLSAPLRPLEKPEVSKIALVHSVVEEAARRGMRASDVLAETLARLERAS